MSTAHAIRKVLALPTPTPALESDVRFYNDKFYVCDGAAWNEVSLGGAGSGATPKVYRALLTQSSTDAPVATVFENTLGGEPVWSRTQEGAYLATLTNAFPLTKTFCLVSEDNASRSFAASFGHQFVSPSANILRIDNYDDSWTNIDGLTLYVQILVYP